jgi:tRNA 2-thiouridine synthesizing protein A
MSDVALDLRGLKCPLPVLRTRKALLRAAIGDIVEVRCNDPMAAIDIPAMVQQRGDRLRAHSRIDDELVFVIEKAGLHD